MATYHLIPAGTTLDSENAATRIRSRAEAFIKNNHRICFDMTQVEAISTEYAQALFGSLVKNVGVNAFIWHVSMRGVRHEVMDIVAKAAMDADKESCESALKTLASVRNQSSKQRIHHG